MHENVPLNNMANQEKEEERYTTTKILARLSRILNYSTDLISLLKQKGQISLAFFRMT